MAYNKVIGLHIKPKSVSSRPREIRIPDPMCQRFKYSTKHLCVYAMYEPADYDRPATYDLVKVLSSGQASSHGRY